MKTRAAVAATVLAVIVAATPAMAQHGAKLTESEAVAIGTGVVPLSAYGTSYTPPPGTRHTRPCRAELAGRTRLRGAALRWGGDHGLFFTAEDVEGRRGSQSGGAGPGVPALIES